ncbi:MAG TPA: hypothetical protein VG435_18330 [Acidimicrobiales bacterium]|jgi:hypothetical protein|nr:hypothetical protein [Acidimicrobiales bacterium]
MRARLMMKLMGLIMMIVLTAVSARSCQSSSSNSPLNPSTFGANGLAGVCADQQAVAQAQGDTSEQTVVIPGQSGNLDQLAQSAGLSPGVVSCNPTTSTTSDLASP